MFVASYILILCASTAFLAWAVAMAATRAVTLFGGPQKISHGSIALCCTIAFLVVVGAPAAILISALTLLATPALTRILASAPLLHYGVPALAAAIGLSGLPLAAMGGLPVILIGALVAAMLLAITLSSTLLPESYTQSALCLTAPLLPLCVAPLFSSASYLTVDALLLIASLLATTRAHAAGASLGAARPALAFLVAAFIAMAALTGAWLAALVSLGAWGGALAYSLAHDPSRKNHAFTF
jgi:hypothetical protein